VCEEEVRSGQPTARVLIERLGRAAVGTNRSSLSCSRESVARGDARSRTSRASSLDGVPEKPDGTRARFGTAATRVFQNGARRRPTLPSLGSRGRDAVLGALSRVEDTDRAFKRRRIDSPVLTRDESTTPPAKGQIAHVTASRDDPIATCLVPRDRFSGRALRTARARTFSALRRRAVARGLTRLGRRVDEREFLSCRSRADRCGRCGDRWRFASALAAGETKVVYFLRVFQTAKPARHDRRNRVPALRHRSTRSSDLKETAAPRFS
jgi:hypothetical protein